MRFSVILAVLLSVSFSGCQRIHTETAGASKQPANQPAYTDKAQNPDPNQPGTAQ